METHDLADLHRLLRIRTDADNARTLEVTVDHHTVRAGRNGQPAGPPVRMHMPLSRTLQLVQLLLEYYPAPAVINGQARQSLPWPETEPLSVHRLYGEPLSGEQYAMPIVVPYSPSPGGLILAEGLTYRLEPAQGQPMWAWTVHTTDPQHDSPSHWKTPAIAYWRPNRRWPAGADPTERARLSATTRYCPQRPALRPDAAMHRLLRPMPPPEQLPASPDLPADTTLRWQPIPDTGRSPDHSDEYQDYLQVTATRILHGDAAAFRQEFRDLAQSFQPRSQPAAELISVRLPDHRGTITWIPSP